MSQQGSGALIRRVKRERRDSREEEGGGEERNGDFEVGGLEEMKRVMRRKEEEIGELQETVRREREEKEELKRKLEGFKTGVSRACAGINVFLTELEREVGKENGRARCGVKKGVEGLKTLVQQQVTKWGKEGLVDLKAMERMAKEGESTAEDKQKKDLRTMRPEQQREVLPSEQQQEVEINNTPVINGTGGNEEHGFLWEEKECLRRNSWTCKCGVRCKSKAGLVNHVRISVYGSFMYRRFATRNLELQSPTNQVTPSTSGESQSGQGVTSTPYNTRKKKLSQLALNFGSPVGAPLSPPSSESSNEGGASATQIKTEPVSKANTASSSAKVISQRSIPAQQQNKRATGRPTVSRLRHGVHPQIPLQCICGLTTTHTYLLMKHIQYYKMDRTFACQLCPKLFVNQGYLNTHYRTKHKSSKVLPAVDGRKRKFRKLYNSSLINLEPSAQSDPQPGSSFFFKSTLALRTMSKKRRVAVRRKRKLLRITAKERIVCSQCHRRFPHLRDLAKHLSRRIHSAAPYRGTAGKRRRNRNLTGGHSGGSGPGSSSSYSSSSAGSGASGNSSGMRTRGRSSMLRSPGMSMEPTVNKSRECPCGKKCNLRVYNKRKGPPRCFLCRMRFVCVELLRTHLWDTHKLGRVKSEKSEKPGGGDKTCKTCGTEFRSTKGLERHVEAANCSSPVRVKMEPGTAKREPVTSEHRKTTRKSGQRGPSAPVLFQETRNVKVHRQVSIRGQPNLYKCTCGKLYSNNKSFQKHLRERAFGKVFSCPTCNYQFTKYYNMRVHIRDMHGVSLEQQPRYGCGNCGQTFETNADRIVHRMNQHGQHRVGSYLVPKKGDQQKKKKVTATKKTKKIIKKKNGRK